MPASAASIFSASRPSTAAIELVPAGAASAIALPRSTTALITLAASTASAAASPGLETGTRPAPLFLRFDDFAAGVVTAVAADRVRLLRPLAVRTRLDLDQRER